MHAALGLNMRQKTILAVAAGAAALSSTAPRRKKLFRAKGSVGGPGCPLSLHVLGRFAIFARLWLKHAEETLCKVHDALLAAQLRGKRSEASYGRKSQVDGWVAFKSSAEGGFTADGSVENFKRRRQTELKHGRISMLATMGYITPEITGKFPGYLSPSAGLKFADVPNGLAAISKVPAAGWGQILAYMAFCEVSQDQSPGTPAAAGDFGFKVLTSSDPAEKTKKLSAELANGRLAMMAIIGMFFQDGLTGSAWGDWANYTASPLRAFENELGVQDPVGFWDPAGFTADGSVENFKRRRQTELKHGRISMLATMGYITPEITGKFPGYLSPSAGLKFADVPNGLAAISKVPAAGWGQILAYMAFCEVSQDQSPGTPAAAGDFGFKVLTSSDPAEKTKKLSAELANGRLAMMAIIGMFFQDGLTGSAWGDWANYTASPLRAFENELGVQDPVGFWDPAGFTADGSVENFKRRRQTELKHGRISMLATMGYITPERLVCKRC
ncbi:Caroteno-chlorophyll a-c-binding protein [Symbiodinium microadriaticum]|uniref:Caroteno-chlorophyll a-c-binding protein n=1 Tax=Symbiodinium microadriaticum TaxID=2951 RepID=A0A1Q9C8A0_SYMMI|nr:Caroteno-chlorophyll a-c-binding protein [Symbiodinium microadriaticum]